MSYTQKYGASLSARVLLKLEGNVCMWQLVSCLTVRRVGDANKKARYFVLEKKAGHGHIF